MSEPYLCNRNEIERGLQPRPFSSIGIAQAVVHEWGEPEGRGIVW
jgi:hypothetical protein